MNWTIFFVFLVGAPVAYCLASALVSLAIWLDEKLGGWWGGAICFGSLLVAIATLVGQAA